MADNNEPISSTVPDTLPNILVDGGAWLGISKGALRSFAYKYAHPKFDVGFSSDCLGAEKNGIIRTAEAGDPLVKSEGDSHTIIKAVKPRLSFLDLPYDIRHTVC